MLSVADWLDFGVLCVCLCAYMRLCILPKASFVYVCMHACICDTRRALQDQSDEFCLHGKNVQHCMYGVCVYVCVSVR
jgi:hypothetical protein